MAYKNNIPQPGDRLASSQNDILNNFAEIDTLLEVDHVEFGNANQGKHNHTTLVAQGADPVTLGNEVSLFTKNGTDGNPQLYWRAHSSGIAQEMTYKNTANPGYTVLPSGIIMHYGSSSFAGGEWLKNVFLATPLPNAMLSIQVTANTWPTGGYGHAVFSASENGLGAITVLRQNNQTTACTFTYLVIGW